MASEETRTAQTPTETCADARTATQPTECGAPAATSPPGTAGTSSSTRAWTTRLVVGGIVLSA
ncbi:hypothetical protein ACFWI5_11035, partial [Streptomyces sp. NPDC127064]